MSVRILRATERPLELISFCAGQCYGKSNYSEKRVKACYDRGHMSVFEHVTVTFQAWNISRACTHQLVRHRMASYSQLSQRYTKLTRKDLKDRNWYVMPPDISSNKQGSLDFHNAMYEALKRYLYILEGGLKPEDARFALPEATKTEICVTMNLREIYHFLNVRYSSKAQWEIRKLAEDLHDKLCNYPGMDNDQWRFLMNLWETKRER